MPGVNVWDALKLIGRLLLHGTEFYKEAVEAYDAVRGEIYYIRACLKDNTLDLQELRRRLEIVVAEIDDVIGLVGYVLRGNEPTS